jgi:hypothetical protein
MKAKEAIEEYTKDCGKFWNEAASGGELSEKNCIYYLETFSNSIAIEEELG